MRKRRIGLLILWLLSLVAISVYGGNISYSFFWTVTLLPAVSGLYLFYVYLRFLVYQKLDTRNIVCGQSVPYCFILQNHDFTAYAGVQVKLFSDFSYVEQVPDSTSYRLFPGGRCQFDTQLTCKYRGEYDVGVKEIILTDFFNIFRLKYEMPSTIRALVIPKIVQLQELRSIADINLEARQMNDYEQTEPDVLVRNYIEGDSLRQIHWKATAATGELKTRLYTGMTKQKIVLFADFERTEEKPQIRIPSENKVLECVIALLYFFMNKHTQARLVWLGNELQSRECVQPEGFETIYQELSSLLFFSGQSFEKLLEELQYRNMLYEGSIQFWVVHQVNEQIMSLAQLITQKGKQLVIYAITGEDLSSYRKQTNARLRLIQMDSEQNLDEVL